MIDTETIKRRKRNNQIKNGVLGLACTLILLVVGVSTYSRYTTTHSNELYVYNAGEYIDPDLIEEFEQETGIKVTYDVFETLEEMYPVNRSRRRQLRCSLPIRLHDSENEGK